MSWRLIRFLFLDRRLLLVGLFFLTAALLLLKLLLALLTDLGSLLQNHKLQFLLLADHLLTLFLYHFLL